MPTETFDAGSPALTFANWTGTEIIKDYSELVAGSVRVGLVDAGRGELLQKQAQAFPFRANDALAEVRILAGTIQRLFAAVAEGRAPAAGDLDFLNDALGKAMAHLALAPGSSSGAGTCEWVWRDDKKADLDCMLWPVVRDAAELLVGHDPLRIHLCQGNDCERLYLDTSKAGRRRWCQMESCGNRAKARRFAQRHSGRPS